LILEARYFILEEISFLCELLFLNLSLGLEPHALHVFLIKVNFDLINTGQESLDLLSIHQLLFLFWEFPKPLNFIILHLADVLESFVLFS
jgi:hypothetical protein